MLVVWFVVSVPGFYWIGVYPLLFALVGFVRLRLVDFDLDWVGGV